MTETVVTDKAGKTLNVTKFNGRLYPRFAIESLNHCLEFKARSDDILLCTYPKSGTHWAFTVIHYLLAGTTDLPLIEKDDTMIEDVPPSSLIDLPAPRNLNSHYHFDALSPEFLHKKSKIIYMTRDPRDVAASYFNHHKKFTQYYEYHGEWKDYFHLYVDGQVDYDSWFEYTKGFEKGMKENPDHPFLVMSYEAMKEDALREVKRIDAFLGTKRDEELLKEVVKKSSFDVMKAARIAEDTLYVNMYRKGQVGDWKNYFTVAQSEYFNQVFEKEMADTNAHKLYSHTVNNQADANMNAV